MTRLTFQDISTQMNNIQSYDLMNAIRNSSSAQFQQYVPLANAQNVAEVGAALLHHQTLQNEFITSLIDRIGLVVIQSVSLKNPLSKFKKGTLEYGRQIEEIFVDISKEHQYDPDTAEREVYKREIPNVSTIFHEINREGFFKQTIQDVTIKRAFTSWNDFEKFTSDILNSMYNSDEVHEFLYMKMIIENYYAQGLFKVEKIEAPVDNATSMNFVKKLRLMARKLTLESGSRDYNAMAVHTRSTMEDLHLFITPEIEAEIDVEVLAKAFNMNKSDFIGHITVVDNFASPGLQAVLVDSSWFMVYDVLFSSESQRNSQGLYWNHFLHHHQVLSASRFANAIAFVDDDEVAEVTNVIIDPLKSSIKAGNEMQFNAYVRKTTDDVYDVSWKVEAVSGSKKAGTTIDNNGLLKVADNEEVQLKVTATVSYGDETSPETVSSEARVIVIPKNI